jgi:hypothetical protein
LLSFSQTWKEEGREKMDPETSKSQSTECYRGILGNKGQAFFHAKLLVVYFLAMFD